MLAVATPGTPVAPPEADPTLSLNARKSAPSTVGQSFWYEWRSVIAACSLTTCLTLGLLSPPLISEGSWLAFHLNNIGWMLFLTGVFVRLWSILYIGNRKSLQLVCEGPYSICRNPLYWGTLLMMVSQVLFFKTGMLAVGLVLPLWIYLAHVVPVEEAVLRERLGAEYLAYCERVPRFWPRFSLFTTSPHVDVSLRTLWRELKQIAFWIWLPFAGMMIGRLRLEAWWWKPLNLF